MLQRNFLFAWRSIRRQFSASLLNVTGLTIGITCFLLLSGYLWIELSYDRFHADADRIVVVSAGYQSGSDLKMHYSMVTPSAVAPTFKQHFPEVETAVRVFQSGKMTIRKEDASFNQPDMIYADADFFNVLQYPLLSGDVSRVLTEPGAVVLTESLARRLFGEVLVTGKTVHINGTDWNVTGVVSDPPKYTRLPFSAVLSYSSLARAQEVSWGAANDLTLIKLKDAAQLDLLQTKADALIAEFFKEEIANGFVYDVVLERLPEVHLYSKVASGARLQYLYILSGIAVALLLIACVNFVNMMTARAAERAHEVGLKKIMGAGSTTLFWQFITESFLLVIVATAAGLFLSTLLISPLGNALGINLQLPLANSSGFFGAFVLFVLTLTLLTGAWPARVLSSYETASALSGSRRSTENGGVLRRYLVVFQFAVSAMFIIGTIVAVSQMRYIQSADTGLNRSQTLVVDINTGGIYPIKNAISAIPGVDIVSASYDSPVNIQGGYTLMGGETLPANFELTMTAIPVEVDFPKLFDLHLLSGDFFNQGDAERVMRAWGEREYGFLLNEEAVRALGWQPKEATGKWLNLNNRQGRVKGVVENFHFASFHEEIEPVILFPEYSWFGKLFVKLGEGVPVGELLTSIETKWAEVYPDVPFEYHFLDQEYNELHRQDWIATQVLTLFAGATILVAVMGLFGLAAFTAQRRTKEIGIRKVLGATAGQVIAMLSVDFLRLMIVAIGIATPIAWFAMNSWLQNFAYRIAVSWWMLAIAVITMLLFTVSTVVIQTWRVAQQNPVKSLNQQ